MIISKDLIAKSQYRSEANAFARMPSCLRDCRRMDLSPALEIEIYVYAKGTRYSRRLWAGPVMETHLIHDQRDAYKGRALCTCR